jgi:hypothetical protein
MINRILGNLSVSWAGEFNSPLKPTTNNQQPTTINHQPATTTSNNNQQPSTNNQQPTTIGLDNFKKLSRVCSLSGK